MGHHLAGRRGTGPRLLATAVFTRWFGALLPDLAAGAPAPLFTPVQVSDRRIAHPDALDLSRAWPPHSPRAG